MLGLSEETEGEDGRGRNLAREESQACLLCGWWRCREGDGRGAQDPPPCQLLPASPIAWGCSWVVFSLLSVMLIVLVCVME